MIYLPGNNSGIWRLRREGFNVGMMFSPDGARRPFRGEEQLAAYALDNGLYHKPDQPPKPRSVIGRFYGLLAKAADAWPPPLFAVVPDVPYNAEATYAELAKHAPILRELFPSIPLALAVQDGMTPKVGVYCALKAGCAAIFVAGSDAWKESTVWEWVERAHAAGMLCHGARANETARIELFRRAGCDSSDGTGIWRGDKKQKGRVLRALTQELMFAQVPERRAVG